MGAGCCTNNFALVAGSSISLSWGIGNPLSSTFVVGGEVGRRDFPCAHPGWITKALKHPDKITNSLKLQLVENCQNFIFYPQNSSSHANFHSLSSQKAQEFKLIANNY
ncbi:alr2579 [Nostoc sp. PCC 7120 = FACHB-418]|nr:alr2579 [Nostoc sp. PCC 7120 = FACHB-418]